MFFLGFEDNNLFVSHVFMSCMGPMVAMAMAHMKIWARSHRPEGKLVDREEEGKVPNRGKDAERGTSVTTILNMNRRPRNPESARLI